MSNFNVREFISKQICALSSRLMFGLHRGGGSGNGWRHTLQWVEDELDNLGESTEDEFLGVGAKLQGFYQRTEEISELSKTVGALLAGEKSASFIEGFNGVVRRIKMLESESRQSARALQRLMDIMSSIGGQLHGFHKTVRSLRVLCVSNRIESARLGNKDIGFNDLTDEVDKLASEIEDKSAHLKVQSESLSELVGGALSRVTSIEDRQRGQVVVILNSAMASLESLVQRHAESSASVAQIGTRYEGISQSIGEIVSSMQFHDITRQRVEHAREAIKGVCGQGRPNKDSRREEDREAWNRDTRVVQREQGANGGSRRHEAQRQLGLAAGICQLQVAQLRSAKDALIAAVSDIIENLRGVAELVAEIVRETQRMAGAADETGKTFLAEVEASFSQVTSSFSAYAEADRELSSVMGSLGETLEEMSSFAGEIEVVGERIKLIALNAVVKASHFGEEGATLGVLAKSIHQLSMETRERTGTVGSTLRSMTSEAKTLRENTANDEAGGNGMRELQQFMATLLADLQMTNGNTTDLLTQMNEKGHALSEDILRVLDSITVHRRIERVINDVVSELEEVVATAQSIISPKERIEPAEHMTSLEAFYTMQHEREVHRSIVAEEAGAIGNAAAPSEQAVTRSEGGDQPESESEDFLGDNVELF